ncbi:WAP four-disulfide core domain protein 12-like [Pollicipes pollicipes]|uniref:WAP four-disulfide core domain protein 12-like n=1 Tax=Pollicipes pollicipes TaxID=41117 RepID=UPI0018857C35|nr:WAP four-disulfide core domain protein 12-like [Pollicipes pollicipes]
MASSPAVAMVALLVIASVNLAGAYWPTTPSRVCPFNDLEAKISCLANTPDQCTSDAQCSGTRRCCKYGCSRRCVPTCSPCSTGQRCMVKETCVGPGCGPLSSQLVAACENLPAPHPCTFFTCPPGKSCADRGGPLECI